jgi:resuscitation-promoting factor RpfA
MRARITAAVVAGSALALGVTTLTAGTARAATGSTWDRLAQCESGGNWSINTGNGYSGGLQFSPSTWRAYGGTAYASSAYKASRSAQVAVAQRVLAAQGWGAWPACSAKLGLRGKAGAGSAASAYSTPRRAAETSRSRVRKPLATSHRVPRVTQHQVLAVQSAPRVAPAPGANYVVGPGDSLSRIAARKGVSGGWQRIYALNRAQIGVDPDLIFPGQRLRLH